MLSTRAACIAIFGLGRLDATLALFFFIGGPKVLVALVGHDKSPTKCFLVLNQQSFGAALFCLPESWFLGWGNTKK